ncbi:MAG: NUDIX domain-containing protein [Candidatus Falkowbacteria bacterium]
MENKKLNIIDDNDNIIGTEDRKIIHKNGLLHREVHVYFVTPKNEIIFQHRAKDKETFPDLLDATVGGHVEIGDDYKISAVKETIEETGVSIKISDLIPIDKVHKISKDNVTKKINHTFRQNYIYIYDGKVKNLKIEVGEGMGFVAYTIKKLLNLNDTEKSKFIPCVYKFTNVTLIDFINNLNFTKL